MKKRTKLSKFWISHSKNTDLNEVINNPNITFLGTQADQPFTAFYVWEKFFTEYGKGLQRFMELGCDFGGMSQYFALWCLNIGAQYIGYDYRVKKRYKATPVMRMIDLYHKIRRGNLYASNTRVEIQKEIQSKGKVVIFCDCIDKPWEFRTFAPILKKNDFIVMHDWDRAIKSDWVEDTLKNLEPYKLVYEEERLQLNTLTRFFLKE